MKKTKEKEKKLNNQKQQKILPNQLKLKNILEKKKEHYNINVTNNAAKALEGIKNNIKEDYNKKNLNLSKSKDIEKIIERNESKVVHHINQEEKYIISKRNLKKIQELKWNNSKVTNMSYMFSRSLIFIYLRIEYF